MSQGDTSQDVAMHGMNAAQVLANQENQRQAALFAAQAQQFGQQGLNQANQFLNSNQTQARLAQAQLFGQQGLQQANQGLNRAQQFATSDQNQARVANAQRMGQQYAQQGLNQANQGLNRAQQFATSDQNQARVANAQRMGQQYAQQGMNQANRGLQQGQQLAQQSVTDGKQALNTAARSAAPAFQQGLTHTGKIAASVTTGAVVATAVVGNTAQRLADGKAVDQVSQQAAQLADGKVAQTAANGVNAAVNSQALNQAQHMANQGLHQANNVAQQALNSGAVQDVQNLANQGMQQAGHVANQGMQQAQQFADGKVVSEAKSMAGQGLNAAGQVASNVANSGAAERVTALAGQGVNVAGQGVGQAANYVQSGNLQGDLNQLGGAAVNAGRNLVHSDEAKRAQALAQQGVVLATAGATVALSEMKNIQFDGAMDKMSSVFKPAAKTILPAISAAGVVGKQLISLVKIEIFRDFFQVLSLFFEGLKESMPESFKLFWAKISAFFAICFSCWIQDWYDANRTTVSVVLFYIEMVVSILVAAVFIHRWRKFRPQASIQGLEVKSWAQRSSAEKTWAKYAALFLTSAYLPVFRDCVQVFTCDLKYVGLANVCGDGDHILMGITAAVACVVYLIPIPIIFYKVIEANKPKISLYDAEGNLKTGKLAYTDADYRQDLEKDTNPYKTLYEGYERKWAFYKVIIMVMKVCLVTPVALLVSSNAIGGRDIDAFATDGDVDTNVDGSNLGVPEDGGGNTLLLVQSITVMIVLVAYAGASWSSRPFLDNSDDYLDAISRGCCVVVSIFGLLTWFTAADEAFGIILNVITTSAAICMITLFVSQLGPVQLKWKNFTQQIDLSMSRVNEKTPLVFSPELNLNRERKLRIWHEWWDVLFAQDADFKLPNALDAEFKESGTDVTEHGNKVAPLNGSTEAKEKKTEEEQAYKPVELSYLYGGSPPYLLNFRGSVMERHLENKEIAAHESFESYEKSLFLLSAVNTRYALQLQAEMRLLVELYTGQDIYWDGMIEGPNKGEKGTQQERSVKQNQSKTKFGRMYITPFPFCATIVMDDTEALAVISLAPVVDGVRRDTTIGIAQFQRLIRIQKTPEVQRRRNVRRQLRALHGQSIYFPVTCFKTKTHGSGKTKKKVQVKFHFTQGILSVTQHSASTWENPNNGQKVFTAHGFEVSLSYKDGEGSYRGKQYHNETHKISHKEMGIFPDYRANALLGKLLGMGSTDIRITQNYKTLCQHMPTLMRNMYDYRLHYFYQFQTKEHVLSYAFWYYVYNNHYVDEETLRYVLNVSEENSKIQAIPDKYSDSLKVLYARLKYFDSHPGIALWFTFWHDVYVHNKDMDIFKNNPETLALIDPFNSTSLLYRPLLRPELETLLQKHKLGGAGTGCFGLKKGFINSSILDKLYVQMADKGTIRVVRENRENKALMGNIRRNYGIRNDFNKKNKRFVEFKQEGVKKEMKKQVDLGQSNMNFNPMAFNQEAKTKTTDELTTAEDDGIETIPLPATTPTQPMMPHANVSISTPAAAQPAMRTSVTTVTTTTTTSNAPTAAARAPPLPDGWVQAVDRKTGRPYYINTVLKKTSWTHPNRPASFSRPSPGSVVTRPLVHNTAAPATNTAVQTLPAGWTQAVDRNGRTYYRNHQTKSTSWTLPAH